MSTFDEYGHHRSSHHGTGKVLIRMEEPDATGSHRVLVTRCLQLCYRFQERLGFASNHSNSATQQQQQPTRNGTQEAAHKKQHTSSSSVLLTFTVHPVRRLLLLLPPRPYQVTLTNSSHTNSFQINSTHTDSSRTNNSLQLTHFHSPTYTHSLARSLTHAHSLALRLVLLRVPVLCSLLALRGWF